MDATFDVGRSAGTDPGAMGLPGSMTGSGRAFRGAGPLVLLSLAYYLGSQVGLALRFPPATTSLLWPPNAILTAALILTAPRRWWAVLAAAFPAHLLAQHSMEWPTTLVLALFGTNCLEAVIGAAIVRAWNGEREPLSRLERTSVFILGAVLLGPFLSSFVDAALVHTLRGEPYWGVWQTRFYANTVTELTVASTLVLGISNRRAWLRGALTRYAEAGLLATGLLVVSLLVFVGPGSAVATPEVHASVVLFLPLLLWAAVRFGPGGTAIALLASALLGIGTAIAGHRPFSVLPAAQSVLAFQIFLALVGVPMLLLASLLEERRAAERALIDRLRYNRLLSELSSAFVHLPSYEMDRAFVAALRQVGEYLNAESAVMFRFAPGAPTLHSWRAGPQVPSIEAEPDREYAWILRRLGNGEPVYFSEADELPADAVDELASVRKRGVRSVLAVPLSVGGRAIGGLAFATFSRARTWPQELVEGMAVVGEVLASALARKDNEDALRASEVMKSAILGSLTARVGVLDREGRLIAANDTWLRPGPALPLGGRASIGANYLDALRAETSEGRTAAWEALVGIRSVVDGAAGGFTLEYAAGDAAAEAWFALSVVPLLREGGGAVVSHSDVTERKRAEDEAQRSQRDLAHFLRVSTLGALAASFAHELNQPLTAILANAQAARMLLDTHPPDLAELREILTDMIDEDRRAGEIIRRSRELLKKGVPERVPVDVNACVREVARLLHGDAVIRKVGLRLELHTSGPLIQGDKVQLQQVLLNLVLNAMEAMAGAPPEARHILLSTHLFATDKVRVSVRDHGTGIGPGGDETVFEAFHTTKAGGMGMGLSIARSMVQAHGGTIWVRNNDDRGATFGFDLPRLFDH